MSGNPVLFQTVSYKKLNFKIEIDSKMCTFKKVLKTCKKFNKKQVAILL